MIRLTPYRSERRLVQLVSTLIFAVMPFLNLLRMDIPTLKFYFLNTILWVDEFFLVFLVFMMAIWIIIIISMVYGRVWSGWMCPQMILNEVSIWLEMRIYRLLGRKPRQSGESGHPAAWIILTAVCFVISLGFAFLLVGYFVDPYRMIADILKWNLTPVTGGIILALTLIFTLDSLIFRVKFCTKACPYAMMQLVITDSKSQVVRYIKERDHECVHCDACVRVCIMGIDIRKSAYQTECTHCGDCIDACNAVLNRQGKPGLIEFSYGEGGVRDKWYQKIGFVDAKRWIILGITIAFAITLVVMIHLRQPLSLSASGDRSTLYRPATNGDFINDYSMRISNRDLETIEFLIRCETPDGAYALDVIMDENPITLLSREENLLKISIQTDGQWMHPGPNPLVLSAENTDNPDVKAVTDIVFFMPEEDPLAGMGVNIGQ